MTFGGHAFGLVAVTEPAASASVALTLSVKGSAPVWSAKMAARARGLPAEGGEPSAPPGAAGLTLACSPDRLSDGRLLRSEP
jgi:hypothetical protein